MVTFASPKWNPRPPTHNQTSELTHAPNARVFESGRPTNPVVEGKLRVGAQEWLIVVEIVDHLCSQLRVAAATSAAAAAVAADESTPPPTSQKTPSLPTPPPPPPPPKISGTG